jgi:hypothetical protein
MLCEREKFYSCEHNMKILFSNFPAVTVNFLYFWGRFKGRGGIRLLLQGKSEIPEEFLVEGRDGMLEAFGDFVT